MSDTQANRPIVAIAGGSSGIGRCTAGWFAARGWNVAVIARGQAGLEATLADVRRAGAQGCFAIADVSDPDAIEAAVEQIETELGPIDAWINVAGISSYGRFLDVPDRDYRRVTDVTYLGTVHGTRAILPRMMRRGHGSIVNIGSAIAKRAVPLQTAYSGAKHAVAGFTEALRAELIHEGSKVQLSIVHPPSVNTPFFQHAGNHMGQGVPRPPPPVYAPEVVADAIFLAVTTGRREVKVGGQTAAFALLNTVAPGLLDQALGLFGFVSQASFKPEAMRNRQENLYDPPAGAQPVHGVFDGWERRHSLQMAANRNPGLAALVVGLGVLSLVAWCESGRGRRPRA